VTLILRRNHHIVRQAGTPEEAERICREHSTDLLVADVKLSDCRSGTDFALRLIQMQPRIKCLFISGLPVENWEETDRHNIAEIPVGSHAVLCKPISPDSLLKCIDDLLANPEPAES
jgi:two-component SAPR family response regulator